MRCVFINTRNEHVRVQYKRTKKSQHDCCRQIIACMDVSSWVCWNCKSNMN